MSRNYHIKHLFSPFKVKGIWELKSCVIQKKNQTNKFSQKVYSISWHDKTRNRRVPTSHRFIVSGPSRQQATTPTLPRCQLGRRLRTSTQSSDQDGPPSPPTGGHAPPSSPTGATLLPRRQRAATLLPRRQRGATLMLRRLLCHGFYPLLRFYPRFIYVFRIFYMHFGVF